MRPWSSDPENFIFWFKYRSLKKKFIVIPVLHLGLFTVMQLHRKLIWHVHFLTSCNHVCERSGKSLKTRFWVLKENPGIWSLQVLESPRKQCFNVCTNPDSTDWQLGVTESIFRTWSVARSNNCQQVDYTSSDRERWCVILYPPIRLTAATTNRVAWNKRAPAASSRVNRSVWPPARPLDGCRCVVVNFHKLHIRPMSADRRRYYTSESAAPPWHGTTSSHSRKDHARRRQQSWARLWHAEWHRLHRL